MPIGRHVFLSKAEKTATQKEDQNLGLKANYCLMQVKGIAD